MQKIDIPGHGIVEFPDGMTDEQITNAIKNNSANPFRTVISEAIKGMSQGGPPAAVLRGFVLPAIDYGNRALEEGAYKAGGAVTDIAAKTGLPPEVSGGLGYGTNVVAQAIPALAGGELMRPLSGPIQNMARRVMQSALKPALKDLKSGKAAQAIDTMLEEGFNPTKSGIEKIKEKINDLNFQIKSVIANSPETVNKGEVGKRLLDEFNKFKNQVNPNSDLETIKNAWMEFRNHPLLAGVTDIPVQIAQDLKQGTYRILNKKYGQLGTADDAAQKALARGLKEEISTKVPEVAGLNAQESKLFNVLGIAEKPALMDANKNIGGLALLTHNLPGFAAFMADRSALAKSLLARMLYSGSEAIPTTAGQTGGAMYSVLQQRQYGH